MVKKVGEVYRDSVLMNAQSHSETKSKILCILSSFGIISCGVPRCESDDDGGEIKEDDREEMMVCV
jgi:hypothetical protein